MLRLLLTGNLAATALDWKPMTSEDKRILRTKIDLGLKASIAAALDEHARAGRKVTIWRDGRIVQVDPPRKSPAEMSTVREEPQET